MKNLSKIGRIIFALPFGIFGIHHLTGADQMAGMVPAFVPGGIIWVYITGIFLVVSSLAILANKMVKQAALGVALLMLLFVLTVHLPGVGSADKMTQMLSMVGLLKDTALLGAALMLVGNSGDS